MELISSLPTKRSAADTNKMNVKVLLIFAFVLIVVSFVTESEAFTPGGGGRITKIQRKRQYEVSFKKSNY